ncbi:5-methylthioadenosine/S-adenosylhomocysteine deaminase [Herbaspirillum sp. Sphag1AN]|uniref:amidohydrolase family protein n=1 Tax=unclassified Herbaspirillum TaxID=2624150 RepID=UPI00161CA326|nr:MULTISPECIES: amidohydrolase [unclassified Herbaspirillum]MBB3213398.1 5-methylthioadenosine/S-adenosylhomocysteine deaminase [Herbaspirillum sp. Sphag1AN]MBB3246558.1 5-methylthioadenosine/S-adenosylhomocysteine deaminase [Herbaspirillum sp. Sphag64]
MRKLLLQADHVIPMTPGNEVITDGAVVVDTVTGIILDIGAAASVRARHQEATVRSLPNRLLMPGLVNGHCHSGILRGTAEGLPVWQWLQEFIDPMHRVLTPQEAEIASRLCYAEALLSGTTTIVDMWRFMHGSALAAKELGIRATLVPYVAEHPDHDYFETLQSNEEVIKTWHGQANGRIQVWVGLEHMFYAVPQAWKRATAMCRDYGVGLHTHSNESQFDVVETQKRYGLRPVQALEKFGLLDAPRVMLAHGCWLDDAEISLLAERGNIGVIHNPTSNMKLASGVAPIEKLLAAGIAVGLGTDGEKENNNLDMFEEMKFASLLTKVSSMNAAALDSWEVCRMATIGGARTLGLEQQIGSLEVGKAADVIAVRTNTPRMTPLLCGKYLNLHHNLVHAVQGGDVELTMVAGQIVVEDGHLKTASIASLIADANAVVPGLFERREAWLKNQRAVSRGAI